ncbi:Periplasmic beta-glucosidase precursor [compost metagenome]
MKHFLANSNEDGRTYTSSDFDERLWREYYSVPFRMGVIEGGSRAYMAAYNKVNGIPAMVHPMLKDITQKEWGQNGIICTDGGAFKLLLSDHKYYADQYLGAAAAVKAGINQFLDDYKEGVDGAIAKGYLTEKDIELESISFWTTIKKALMVQLQKAISPKKILTKSSEEIFG